MSTYIGFFKNNTELELNDSNGYESNYITPISFTVTVDAGCTEEAIRILTEGRVDVDTVSGYDKEFEELVFNWVDYTLQAVVQSLY